MTMPKKTPPLLNRSVAAVLVLLLTAIAPSASAAASPKAEADIMMVLDLSGSMKSRGGARRYESLFEWMETFAGAGDRIGVVAMGYGARLVLPLTDQADFSLDRVRSELVQREKFTDVAAGLETAYYHLKTASSPDRKRWVILYSDAQIDMPGGEWASQNSMRYLLESLKPSLEKDGIQLLSVVPDGLKANFQLLHDLASATRGAYHRGIPDNPEAVRHSLTAFPEAPRRVPPMPVETATASKPAATAPAPPPSIVPPPDRQADKAVVVERVVASETSGWIIALFALFGLAIIGLFGLVFYMLKGKKTAPEESAELTMALKEVQSLQHQTARRRVKRKNTGEIDGSELDPDFGEPKDELSVSLVSPFLEFADDERKADTTAKSDDIAAEPAFSSHDDTEPSFSLSTMENLIGTPESDVENRNE